MMTREQARKIRAMIEKAAAHLTDEDALTAQALFRQTITPFGKYQQIHARHEWKLVKHALHGTLYNICWYGLFFL